MIVDALNWIFGGFWHFVGTAFLLACIGGHRITIK
jgi:hypothetical protein